MPDCAIASDCPQMSGPMLPGPAGGKPDVLSPVPVPAPVPDLLELLAGVTDGRTGQGRDHPVAAVLALAAAAVVAGSRSFTAIAGWVADVPADVLADLYRRCGAARPAAGPPSKATIWRVVTEADTAALDAAAGAWLTERARAAGDLAGPGHGDDDEVALIPVRADGKTVRGARNADGSQVHLLAALAGRRGVVAGQVGVGAKTNEIPVIIPLPDSMNLDQAVITADALHCQRAAAGYLHRRGADFVLPAKDNQPGLPDALDALPWRDVPVARAVTDRGHGRVTTRTIQVMDAPENLPFPRVSQVYLIERHVTALNGTPLSEIAALGVTSLSATRAAPETIAGLVRGQWAIESLHRVATPSTAKTSPGSAPDPGQGQWPPSGTSASARSGKPDGRTPPRPPGGPAAPSTGLSPSSA